MILNDNNATPRSYSKYYIADQFDEVLNLIDNINTPSIRDTNKPLTDDEILMNKLMNWKKGL